MPPGRAGRRRREQHCLAGGDDAARGHRGDAVQGQQTHPVVPRMISRLIAGNGPSQVKTIQNRIPVRTAKRIPADRHTLFLGGRHVCWFAGGGRQAASGGTEQSGHRRSGIGARHHVRTRDPGRYHDGLVRVAPFCSAVTRPRFMSALVRTNGGSAGITVSRPTAGIKGGSAIPAGFRSGYRAAGCRSPKMNPFPRRGVHTTVHAWIEWTRTCTGVVRDGAGRPIARRITATRPSHRERGTVTGRTTRLIVLGRRYLPPEAHPQPLSRRLAAEHPAELQPDAEWARRRSNISSPACAPGRVERRNQAPHLCHLTCNYSATLGRRSGSGRTVVHRPTSTSHSLFAISESLWRSSPRYCCTIRD